MALALGSRASMVNLNAADPNSLTNSMRKLQQLRERILTHGVADTIRDDIMEIYEENTDAIERALNKSYMIGGELTNLCIEVVSLTNNSVEETKKIIDVLIDLGADINRWDTQDGEYDDEAENALTWAITNNKAFIVQHLINKGAQAENHDHLLEHFAGHFSPNITRKLERALKGRTPRSGTSSHSGAKPNSRTHSRAGSSSGGPRPGSSSGGPRPNSRGGSLRKRGCKTRKSRK